MFRAFVMAAAAGLTVSAGVTGAAAQDAQAGEKVYRACQACHAIDREQNRVGPHLVGLFGREAGSVEGFKYSDAMANADITWNEETLSKYLAAPNQYIPGNRMAYPGVRDEQDLANLIAYLEEETPPES